MSRVRTSSAWRCVSVLSNTCCKWVRTVVTETDNSSETCLRSAPRTMRKATCGFRIGEAVEAPQQRCGRFGLVLWINDQHQGRCIT